MEVIRPHPSIDEIPSGRVEKDMGIEILDRKPLLWFI
jgi:hypothetical protein